MERLTIYQPTEGGIPYVVLKNNVSDQDALQKLAEYEDSGVEPSYFMHLMSNTIAVAARFCPDIFVDRLTEILIAYAENRLVIIPKGEQHA